MFLSVAVAGLGAPACDNGGEPGVPDAGVEPGWILSRPFPEIETLHDVTVLDSVRAYAVGSEGTILRYDNGTWDKEDSGTTELLRAVSGVRDDTSGDETVVAVGDNGTVLLREGDAWRVLASSTENILFDVWLAAANDGFIVGDQGTILRFTGIEVVPMIAESLLSRRVQGGFCLNAGECAAGETCDPQDPADPNSLLRCADANDPNGLVEELYPIPSSLKTVAGTSGDNVFTAGPSGALYRFDGQRWNPEDMGTTRSVTHLFTEAGTWAVGNDGVILIRQGGNDWDSQSVRAPVPIFLQGLWASDWSDVHVVGLAGTIYSFDGTDWTPTTFNEDFHFRGIDGVVVAPATETTAIVREIFAVGAGGRIAHGPAVLPDE